ncbi:hypothetical protein PRZ48_012050 [Zasmidium cellare]|uniref:Carboxylesterase type B domain-containing protein n=1 Tax=Zasmidium cellare TaxID=395010 RepID=A0ABR0E4A9_ZASCE|nr:hypothetical protein PRZ48_012050 [Zasmidium cellare]
MVRTILIALLSIAITSSTHAFPNPPQSFHPGGPPSFHPGSPTSHHPGGPAYPRPGGPPSYHPRPPPYQPRPDDCVVTTTSGSLQPLVEPDFPDVDQFLGIPFAQSPLRDLRFAPPQTYKPTGNQIFQATTLPPGCPQIVHQQPVTIFDVYEPGLNFYGPTSEDCLKLNVYRPRKPSSEPLPVLIFVYGGGFVSGAANKTFSIPTPWVQEKQNLIVVAIQYRLGIYGFPNSAALAENNVGLEDIRFAVQWVKENVAAFGGDVDRMTLMRVSKHGQQMYETDLSRGHSAGSIATNAYTFAYRDDMIVNSIISMSGTVLTPNAGWQSRDYTHSNFTSVAHLLGCEGSDEALLTCMRSKSASSISEIVFNNNTGVTFLPLPDDKLVFANYSELLMNGQFSKLTQPAIIGSSRGEGFRSLDKNLNPDGPNATEANAYTVASFLCPSQLVSKFRQTADVPTYRYEFKGNFTNISPLPWMGAYHESPLPYLFGQSGNVVGHPRTGASTPFELEFSSYMQDLWQAFIADPNSLEEQWNWPLYEGGLPDESTDAVKLLLGRGDGFTVSSLEYGAEREEYCAKVDPYLITQTLPPGLANNAGNLD